MLQRIDPLAAEIQTAVQEASGPAGTRELELVLIKIATAPGRSGRAR